MASPEHRALADPLHRNPVGDQPAHQRLTAAALQLDGPLQASDGHRPHPCVSDLLEERAHAKDHKRDRDQQHESLRTPPSHPGVQRHQPREANDPGDETHPHPPAHRQHQGEPDRDHRQRAYNPPNRRGVEQEGGRRDQDTHRQQDPLGPRHPEEAASDGQIDRLQELDEVFNTDHRGRKNHHREEGHASAQTEKTGHNEEQRVVEGKSNVAQHLHHVLAVGESDTHRGDDQGQEDEDGAIQVGALGPSETSLLHPRCPGQPEDHHEETFVELEIKGQEQVVVEETGGHHRRNEAEIQQGEAHRSEQRHNRVHDQHRDQRHDGVEPEQRQSDEPDLSQAERQDQPTVGGIDAGDGRRRNHQCGPLFEYRVRSRTMRPMCR